MRDMTTKRTQSSNARALNIARVENDCYEGGESRERDMNTKRTQSSDARALNIHRDRVKEIYKQILCIYYCPFVQVK